MKLKLTFVVLLGILIYRNCSQKTSQPTAKTEISQKTNDFNYLPTSTTGQVIKHQSYTLSYSEKHEQAEWVAYTLTPDDLKGSKKKRPYFITDPMVKTKSADWCNYKKSGYDRGHLCPAGDRKSDKKRFNETFYTSNISPQKHIFNSGIWEKLEQKVRYWANKYKHLYIITGGILTDSNLETIGYEKVSVPKYFYKIILDYTEPEIKAIAFLMPHQQSKSPLKNFVVSIDDIEKLTRIDFFPELPDNLENKLESSKDYKKWGLR